MAGVMCQLWLWSCLFLQFLSPLGLTLALAAILVKTSTIYSIFISTFQVGSSFSYVYTMSPRGLVSILDWKILSDSWKNIPLTNLIASSISIYQGGVYIFATRAATAKLQCSTGAILRCFYSTILVIFLLIFQKLFSTHIWAVDTRGNAGPQLCVRSSLGGLSGQDVSLRLRWKGLSSYLHFWFFANISDGAQRGENNKKDLCTGSHITQMAAKKGKTLVSCG